MHRIPMSKGCGHYFGFNDHVLEIWSSNAHVYLSYKTCPFFGVLGTRLKNMSFADTGQANMSMQSTCYGNVSKYFGLIDTLLRGNMSVERRSGYG